MTARYFIRQSVRCIPIIAIAIVIGEVILANHLVFTSQQVHKMDGAIDSLRDENELLRQQVASASAITIIATKAVELGMVPTQNVLSFIPEDFSVALAR